MVKSVACGILALAILTFVAVYVATSSGQRHREPSLASVRIALKAQHWKAAEAEISEYLQKHPGDPKALLLAGEIAGRQKKLEQALRFYSAIKGDREAEATARFYSGEIRSRLGRLREAEADFHRAMTLVPAKPIYRSRLALLLLYAGRRWEAGPLLLSLLQQGDHDFQQLCLLGDPARLASNKEQLEKLRRLSPEDPLIPLGLAKIALLQEDSKTAEQLLRKVVREHPQIIEAQVQYGGILASKNERGQFLSWHSDLGDAADEHPQLWYVRGMFADSKDEREVAARCFWEALRCEPNHLGATSRLGQVLSALGRSVDATRLEARARKLERVSTLIGAIHQNPRQAEIVLEIASYMRDLGRIWEARAWFEIVHLMGSPEQTALATQQLSSMSVPSEMGQTLTQESPAQWLDCHSYPLPDWKVGTETLTEAPRSQSTEKSHFQFQVTDVGIDFQYFNSDDPVTPGRRMFEFTGGGVGVLDFDVDGYPDLYFPQGCQWPPNPHQSLHVDRLYRNRGEGFDDVTGLAMIQERGFSQGLACGDLNGDGFDDVYVANIGANSLFMNNGDGTFTDVSDAIPRDKESADPWTVSAAIADLNSDALPDIVDVNYVRGPQLFDLICGQSGIQRVCSPTEFEAAPDRALANLGDGNFDDISARAHITAPDGTGLGIVVGDFDRSGRLSIFVANDARNNHFYEIQSDSPGRPPWFEEKGLLNGLAFDKDGRSQACMGVAVGDADGNGFMDLFVTNYVDESNTLYLQKSAGYFADVSRAVGLTEPSFKMLGFGTQFLDVDLDGWEDLVVANGHVDDFTHRGYEHRMRPQFFQNEGGRFREVRSEGLGRYFEEPKLGRGLARLDWNRDGFDDFVVSHLEAAVALVTNRTRTVNNKLQVQIVARQTSRDAVGTHVSLYAGERRIVRQRTAGHGYAATNENVLTFGLGNHAEEANAEVVWPSGTTESFNNLAPGARWLLVEGRRPLRLTNLNSPPLPESGVE